VTERLPLYLDPRLTEEIRARLTPGESLDDFVRSALRTRLDKPEGGHRDDPEYLRGLQAITAALANARDLEEVCDVILRETGGAGEPAIWRLENGRLLLVGGSELSRQFPEIPLDDRYPARANLASGEALFVEDRDELLARWPILESAPTHAFAGLPLVVEGRRHGLMAIGYTEDHPFSQGERNYLRSVAEQAAVAIERAELRQVSAEAQTRREVIAEATFEMSAPHSSAEALLQRLADLAVPRFADWSMVYVRRGERFERVASARSAVIGDEAEAYSRERPLREMLLAAGAHENEAWILTTEPGDATPGASALLEHLGLSSLICVPVSANEHANALMLFGSGAERAVYRNADLSLASSLAARATIALDHHRTEQERRAFAETITRAILPGSFPALPGLSFGACFEPSGEGSVGGDWYDVFELRGGGYAVVVGDVSGHGVQAAAAMARLRNGLFAFTSEGHDPATALARLAPLLAAPDSDEDGDLIATVQLTTLDPATGALEVANAGHPPPLMVRAGAATFGPGGGTVLAPTFEPSIAQYSLTLEPGDLLVAYTDGLVERPGEDYEECFRRIADAALALSAIEDLDEFCRRLVESTAPAGGRRDDCCVIALRRDGHG